MSAFTSMFKSALSFSMDMQSIQDNFPEHAKVALSGVKSGTTYILENVHSKIGEVRRFKTSTGTRELIERGPIGTSANIIKVRCTATGIDFIMKRLEMVSNSSVTGTSGLVSSEAMNAWALRANLVPSLPKHPNLVQCYGSESDNTGLAPAKVLLFELCGKSLADTLAQSGGSIDADEILHILRDVADGLFCLHSMESGPVVHGSVEPEHILRDMKSDAWKLGSFGATHSSMEDDIEDAASDIWQLGVLLLTMMFGATAFEKKDLITSKSRTQVLNTLVKSIAKDRPANDLEGRMLLLATWLMAADPSLRPTAEQVVVAVGSLGSLPVPQLSLAVPAHVRKDFKLLCLGLERRTVSEAINMVDGSDRRAMINKYGEEVLQSPNVLPDSVKQRILSTQQSEYIQVLSSFGLAGAENEICPDAEKLRHQLAVLQSQCVPVMQQESTTGAAGKVQEALLQVPAAQEPVDLLGFEDSSEVLETQARVDQVHAVNEPVDLLGFEDSSDTAPQLISAPQANIVCPMDMPSSQVQGQPDGCEQGKASDLDDLTDLFSMPTAQQPPQMNVVLEIPAGSPQGVANGGYPTSVVGGMEGMPKEDKGVQQNPFAVPLAGQQASTHVQQNPFNLSTAGQANKEAKDPFSGLAVF